MRNAGFAEMIDFSRPGSATYVGADGLIHTAAADVPRFDYSNGRRQLLLEGAATNGAYNNIATFNVSGGSPDSTAKGGQPDPSGGAGAYLFTEGPTSGIQMVRTTAGFTPSATTTLSAFVKAGTVDLVQLAISFDVEPVAIANFDISSGTVTKDNSDGTTIAPIGGNGWFRISMTSTLGAGASGAGNAYVVAIEDGSAPRFPQYAGTGRTFYVWGMQTEQGAFPSSYIPTSGSAVTRPADKALFTPTLNGLISRDQWTLVLEAGWESWFSDNDPRYVFFATAGPENIRFGVYQGDIFVGATGGAAVGLAPVNFGDNVKVAICRDGSTLRFSINGGEVGSVPCSAADVTAARLGNNITASTNGVNMATDQSVIWPFAVTDAELRRLSS